MIGKTIRELVIDDYKFEILFTDESKLILENDFTCCERRYFDTDDKLEDYVGSTYLGYEIKDVSESIVDDECCEIQFLEVKTSKGDFQLKNYNEHNGYYGGFDLIERTESRVI